MVEEEKASKRQAFTVLVVDDDPLSRMVIEMQLKRLGYGVQTVGSGREALEFLDGETVHAVLMDCEMPGLDGRETTCRIRAREEEKGEARRFVLALTAHVDEDEIQRCQESGMDDHLVKPSPGSKLGAVLDRWLLSEACLSEEVGAEDPWLLDLETRFGASMSNLMRSWEKESKRQMETVRSAVEGGERDAIAYAAHTLAGSSGIVQALDLEVAARQIEVLARRAESSDFEPLMDRLEAEYRRCLKRLEKLPG